MLTSEQILAHFSAAGSRTLDGRDASRLARFFPVSDWPRLGLELKDGVDPASVTPTELTEENVKTQLANDLQFAFEKALNRRSISAGMMFEVVKMWMWVLDDELKDWDEDSGYAQYGLPLFKAVAVKYDLDNPIGDDNGDEADKYSQDAEWPD